MFSFQYHFVHFFMFTYDSIDNFLNERNIDEIYVNTKRFKKLYVYILPTIAISR